MPYATRLEYPRHYETDVGPEYLNAFRCSTHIADLFNIRNISGAADLKEIIVETLKSIEQISLSVCSIDLSGMAKLLRSLRTTVKVVVYRPRQCGLITPVPRIRQACAPVSVRRSSSTTPRRSKWV
jgi:hypothetical protein